MMRNIISTLHMEFLIHFMGLLKQLFSSYRMNEIKQMKFNQGDQI